MTAATSRRLDALRDPACVGVSSISFISGQPFWRESDLPFVMHGTGIVRLEPKPGFHKSMLAATADELAVIADCKDAPGWLVPEGIVARWLASHIANETLDDVLLSHPLYTHLVKVDKQGHSRGGRGRLVHWTPGVPTQAHVVGPEFLPDDPTAPAVNRQRAKYAAACEDLLRQLDESFGAAEIELALAFAGLKPTRPRRPRH